MNQPSVEAVLRDLHLPSIRFFPTIDSTNDEAWRWVEASAPHGALVIADEQSAGRGRLQRRWISIAGSGLAFSLVLRSPPLDGHLAGRLVGLAAVAICRAIESNIDLQAQIKWPNDILIDQRKTAGILVESRWEGENLVAAVIGIGINIAPESINTVNLPPASLNYPVTCVEAVAGHPVDRLGLLNATLQEVFYWLPSLATPAFMIEWDRRLAYSGEWVELTMESPRQSTSSWPILQTGKLIGLNEDGSIKLQTASGELIAARVGDLRLRPAYPPDEMENDLHV
jgi:BirA family biotin operon repressor/biotin-[acetyl-CoA-carboxylase] ligase